MSVLCTIHFAPRAPPKHPLQLEVSETQRLAAVASNLVNVVQSNYARLVAVGVAVRIERLWVKVLSAEQG